MSEKRVNITLEEWDAMQSRALAAEAKLAEYAKEAKRIDQIPPTLHNQFDSAIDGFLKKLAAEGKGA